MESMMIYMPIAMALLGLAYMLVKKSWVMKQDAGDGKMKEISDHIYEGALAFLNAEYRLLAIFVVAASIVLAGIAFYMESTYLIVVAFVIGAIFSAFAGNMGMKIATKTNVRTTQAAKTSLPNALKVSFGGGTVMGLGVAGLAVLGLTLFFIIFFHLFMGGEWTNTTDMTIVLEALAGFSLGAESIALFARVGGGIYTKAADVGADLAGKVQADIPEDDPRNPATIADNVGDNVGDVAGMGADLFGSYVATVLAAMVLGNYVIKDMGGSITDAFGGIGPILLPMSIAGVGIIISLIGTLLVKISSNDAKEADVQKALNIGNWASILMVAVACYGLVTWMLPATMQMDFFGEGSARDFFNKSILCVFSRLSRRSWNLSIYGILYRPRFKTNLKNCTTIKYRRWNQHYCWFSDRDDFYFLFCIIIRSGYMGLLCSSWILWSCFSSLCNDGNNCNAISN